MSPFFYGVARINRSQNDDNDAGVQWSGRDPHLQYEVQQTRHKKALICPRMDIAHELNPISVDTLHLYPLLCGFLVLWSHVRFMKLHSESDCCLTGYKRGDKEKNGC